MPRPCLGWAVLHDNEPLPSLGQVTAQQLKAYGLLPGKSVEKCPSRGERLKLQASVLSALAAIGIAL